MRSSLIGFKRLSETTQEMLYQTKQDLSQSRAENEALKETVAKLNYRIAEAEAKLNLQTETVKTLAATKKKLFEAAACSDFDLRSFRSLLPPLESTFN